MNISNVSIENVVISNAKEGGVISQADGVSIKNVKVYAKDGKQLTVRSSKNLTVDGTSYAEIDNKGTLININ